MLPCSKKGESPLGLNLLVIDGTVLLKSGKNLITRIRDGKKILECRTCANASLQARREARKRNAKLLKGEV